MISNGYITLEQFASMLGGSTSNLIVEFAEESIETASRDIDNYTSRRFYREEPTTASARPFTSTSTTEVFIDDCYETPTVVAVDTAGDGTYATTLTAAQFEAQRAIIDGVALTDRPFTSVTTVGYSFPTIPRSVNVRVTAKWGWGAVPSPVRSACRRLAHLQYEARNAAFGAAGTAETGYIRLRDDVLACQWLDPFVKNTPKFLVA